MLWFVISCWLPSFRKVCCSLLLLIIMQTAFQLIFIYIQVYSALCQLVCMWESICAVLLRLAGGLKEIVPYFIDMCLLRTAAITFLSYLGKCPWLAEKLFMMYDVSWFSVLTHSESAQVSNLLNVYIRTPSPLIDIIWAVMIVWNIRGKIIRTVQCCTVLHIVHSYKHTHMSGSCRCTRYC